MKHTPGPWKVEGQTTHGNLIVRAPHANCWPAIVNAFNDSARDPEQKANAQLIAAAPTLFLALKALTEYCERRWRSGSDPQAADHLGKARDALAQALGWMEPKDFFEEEK